MANEYDFLSTRGVDLSNPYTSVFSAPPIIQSSPMLLATDQNLASEFYSRLQKWINDYDISLDNDHEVGVRLMSFGQSVTFHLQDIGYWNPSLMRFYGVCDDGTPMELIQHVSQISILLMKLPRLDASKPKGKIGFSNAAEDSETK